MPTFYFTKSPNNEYQETSNIEDALFMCEYFLGHRHKFKAFKRGFTSEEFVEVPRNTYTFGELYNLCRALRLNKYDVYDEARNNFEAD